MLFANLEEMLEIHGRFNSSLKKLREESPLVGDIGPVLLEMVGEIKPLGFTQLSSFCFFSSE
jgi:hypothetical protein